MKIKLIKNGATFDVSDSYGMRLVEQGIAIVAPATPKKPAKKEAAKAGEG